MNMGRLTTLFVLTQMLFAAMTSVAAADQSSRSVTTHDPIACFGIVPAKKALRGLEEGGQEIGRPDGVPTQSRSTELLANVLNACGEM